MSHLDGTKLTNFQNKTCLNCLKAHQLKITHYITDVPFKFTILVLHMDFKLLMVAVLAVFFSHKRAN